ncbi:extracellular solute-binding protein [Jiangella aurantiaca]|uniref:Extracellular solute-binding protein n=1 Tax=Jiangella aurantiaca TaxID=2530373 RepID=A0A4R5A667_9ACTN|nr:extracellular solute-binding protein [Jiangella aurantiaca]TDD66134.1 extracellular solute-binding protein [Jiangella aurantiaca]
MGHLMGRGAMRRRAAIGVTAAALLAVSACGGGSAESSDSGEVTLRFAWWGNDERARITQQAIDAFEAEHPDITVEAEPLDFEGYFDRLATSVAARDAPDVITLGGAYPREYGDRGALLDLSTVAEQLPTDDIDEAALSNGFFSGVQYSIPTGVNTYCVVVNPEVFAAAGVPLPDDTTWTWDDFVAIAQRISDASPEGTYGAADPTSADTLDLFARQRTGSGLYTEDGGVAVEPATAAEWWTMTKAMSQSGATPPATLTAELGGQPSPEQTLMGRGLAGMQLDWSNQLTALRTASGAPLELLRAPGESDGVAPGMWLQASQSYAVSSTSEHPEEAAMLIDFLVNSEEAASFILADRGLPANAEVLEAITPQLDEHTTAQAEFIAEISEDVNPDLVIGPAGSTETRNIVIRLNDEVLFDRISVDDAATSLVDEVSAAIAQ